MPQFRLKSLLLFVLLFTVLISAYGIYDEVTTPDNSDNKISILEEEIKVLKIEYESKKRDFLDLSNHESDPVKKQLSTEVIVNLEKEISSKEKSLEILITYSKYLYMGLVAISFVLAIVAGTFANILYFIIRKIIYSSSVKSDQAQELASEAKEIQNTLSEDFFTNLIKINFKYLDAYYLQTQLQADKSFMLAAVAAMVSLIVIVIGIIMMFFSDNSMEPKITIAVGAFGQFLSAVFFYLYNRTILKMGQYHKKLVLTQNIGLALKITESLSEEHKCESQKRLIDQLTQNINEHLAK